jgi:SagB-type dehydrogenase family enzyme
VAGVPPGVHHFSPGDFPLRRLREADFRRALAEAAADEALARAPATPVLSTIYWRNTWTYQARGYRHLFWDAGSMLANALAAAAALDAPAHLGHTTLRDDLHDVLPVPAEPHAPGSDAPCRAPGAAAVSGTPGMRSGRLL